MQDSCSDINCGPGTLIITEESNKVCKTCGLIKPSLNIGQTRHIDHDNYNYNITDNNGIPEQNIYSSKPSDFRLEGMSYKEAVRMARAFHTVENICVEPHQKRAQKVISKTKTYIENLPSLFCLAQSKNDLSLTSSIIINQIYNSWFAARNYEFYINNNSLIHSKFSGRLFSLPKDSDIISAVAMRVGAQFLRVIKGGISNIEIYKTIKTRLGLTDKFQVHVSKFFNSIKLNKVIDLDRFGGKDKLINITKSHYINMASHFCNNIKLPMKVTKMITDLISECVEKVWLGGRHPINIVVSCIYHIICGCSNYDVYEHEELMLVKLKYPKKKLEELLKNVFSVKNKLLIHCSNKIKQIHDKEHH